MEASALFHKEAPGARLLVYYQFLVYMLSNLPALARPAMRGVLLRQVYFNTVQPVKRFTAVAILTGMVIITQISQTLGYDAVIIGKALLWAVVRELGPLITALLMLTGSGAAITAELASMKVNREFDTLRMMGINPMEYLVVPRMAGAIISLFLLNAYFQMSAILGGFAFSSLLIDISFNQHVYYVFVSVGVQDIALSLVKTLMYGIAISTVACSHGCFVAHSITEVPKAVTRSQVRCLFLLFIIAVI